MHVAIAGLLTLLLMSGCASSQDRAHWRIRTDNASEWYGRGHSAVVDSKGRVAVVGDWETMDFAACGQLDASSREAIDVAKSAFIREFGDVGFSSFSACEDGGADRIEIQWIDPEGSYHRSTVVIEGCGNRVPQSVSNLRDSLWGLYEAADHTCTIGPRRSVKDRD